MDTPTMEAFNKEFVKIAGLPSAILRRMPKNLRKGKDIKGLENWLSTARLGKASHARASSYIAGKRAAQYTRADRANTGPVTMKYPGYRLKNIAIDYMNQGREAKNEYRRLKKQPMRNYLPPMRTKGDNTPIYSMNELQMREPKARFRNAPSYQNPKFWSPGKATMQNTDKVGVRRSLEGRGGPNFDKTLSKQIELHGDARLAKWRTLRDSGPSSGGYLPDNVQAKFDKQNIFRRPDFAKKPVSYYPDSYRYTSATDRKMLRPGRP